MIRTRLVNLTTFELEEYAIDGMPPYVAISHVWAEDLFPVTSIPEMKNTIGMRLVLKALSQIQQNRSLETHQPGHCWADTWCIDQNDSQDKNIQMSAMGNIYRGAELVMIVTDHCFTFSQHSWETALSQVKPVFTAYFQYFDDPSGAQKALMRLPESTIKTFGALARMLGEVASIPWATRIWTAQEYILAKRQCWIGIDEQLLWLSEDDMDYISRAAELFRLELGVEQMLSEAQWRMLSIPQNMHLIKSGTASPLKTMALARDRKCLMPKDQIYGLMGATGVIIKHAESDTLETAWENWCEEAVRNGHVDIICTAAIRKPTSFLEQSWNCAMPTWKDRCDIFQQSYLPSAKPARTPSIKDGSIALTGRVAGLCIVDRYLSRGGLPSELEDLAAICGDDLVLAEKVCCAEDGGVRREQETKERAKAIQAAYLYTTKGDLTKDELDDLQQSIDAFTTGILTRYGFGTHLYLARLVNACNSRDILVFTDEDLYEDEALLALDLNADDKSQLHPLTQLVVARAPQDPAAPMHKAGMTSLVKFHSGPESEVDSCGCEGYAHSEDYREFRLGGSACWYCREIKQALAEQLKMTASLPEGWSPDDIRSGDVEYWCKMHVETKGRRYLHSLKSRVATISISWLWLILCPALLGGLYVFCSS